MSDAPNLLSTDATPLWRVWNSLCSQCHEAGKVGDFSEATRLVRLADAFQQAVKEAKLKPRPAPVPEWAVEEIRATWRAAREASGEIAAFRILERMVDRLGYGRMTDNPPLYIPTPETP